MYSPQKIYIPIWLDLLYERALFESKDELNLHSNMVRFIIIACDNEQILFEYLHSNMVRFIITSSVVCLAQSKTFTFQYG